MKNRRDALKYVPTLPVKNYLILACDGGGMRGYLSSLLLQRLN